MNTETSSRPRLRELLGLAGDSLLLVWMLAIFWHFYNSRGYFDLIRFLWTESP